MNSSVLSLITSNAADACEITLSNVLAVSILPLKISFSFIKAEIIKPIPNALKAVPSILVAPDILPNPVLAPLDDLSTPFTPSSNFLMSLVACDVSAFNTIVFSIAILILLIV